ncbi:MAG: hypothetical protein Unbinned2903contig1001_4 [Prokaryotic dsDNA virus sp.]|mgnify:FL=1|nr:MAG: hypothetical protein Unbinned2903contig1001_4 [Prokaryotic dsDNA virus sp.]
MNYSKEQEKIFNKVWEKNFDKFEDTYGDKATSLVGNYDPKEWVNKVYQLAKEDYKLWILNIKKREI